MGEKKRTPWWTAKGLPHPMKNPETRKKVSETQRKRFKDPKERKKISELTKRAMRNVPYEKLAYWKGKKQSKEFRENRSEYMRKHSPTRDPEIASKVSKALKGRLKKISPSDVKRMVELYSKGLSLLKIAGIIGCSGSNVRKHLKEQGVKLRKPWEYKPWNKGIRWYANDPHYSLESTDGEWCQTEWERIRKKVISRDKECERCGSKRDLVVHHIVPWKVSKDNSLNNLVVLCRACHTKIERNFDKEHRALRDSIGQRYRTLTSIK